MNRILLIGAGGCGGKLLDTGISLLRTNLNLNNEYDFLFINSNKNEMRNLKYYNPQIGLELLGDGTGKDRLVAQESFKLEQNKIGNYFTKVQGIYDMYEIYTSGDGGFGSGICPLICKLIRKLNPEAVINVRAAMPKLNSTVISFKNSLSLYSDMLILIQNNIINNIQFIDNEKMKNEDDFNLDTMRLLIEGMEVFGGSVDGRDILRTNRGTKYRNILKLDNSFDNLEKAIENAIAKSPFVVSDIYNCSNICATFTKGDYIKEELYNIIYHKEFDKVDYSSSSNKNIIVTSGCQMPVSYIKILEKRRDDFDNDIFNMELDDDLSYIPSNVNDNKGIKTKKSKDENIKIDNIEDLFTEDFWKR